MTYSPSSSSPATEGLLPCPFCGKEDVERNSDKWGHWFFCDCGARSAYGHSPVEAASLWNTRAPSPSSAGSEDADDEADAALVESMIKQTIAFDQAVKFDECDTPEPTLRQMIRQYYIQGLQPDTKLALEKAEKFIAALRSPGAAQPSAGTERDAFENWWMSRGKTKPERSTEPGNADQYAMANAEMAWRGWQARGVAQPSRDALIALIRSKARVAGHDAWEGGYYHLANADELADAILALPSTERK